MLVVRNGSAAPVPPPQSHPAGKANPQSSRCLSARGRKPKVVGAAGRGEAGPAGGAVGCNTDN